MHTFTKLLILGVGTTMGIAALSLAPMPVQANTSGFAINTLDHSVVDHGDGDYTTQLQGSGTFTQGTTVKNTSFALSCDVEDSIERVQCVGSLWVNGVAAPIGLRVEDGEARYAISNGFSPAHVASWERWHTDALIDIFPPDFGGNEGGESGEGGEGGEGGGFDFPGGIIVIDQWTVRDYDCSDWTIILDGVVINPW